MTGHINDLPNEILLIIFDYNYRLIEMINCSYVCKRWRALALYRLSLIKGLYGSMSEYKTLPDVIESVDDENRYNLTKLLPNVTVMDNIFDGRGCTLRFIECIQNFEKLRRVRTYYPHLIARATKFPNRINSVSTHYSRRYYEPIITQLGAQLKQLHLMIYPFEILADSVQYMPSLIRVHLQLKPVEADYYYRGPKMDNLRILELVAKNQYGNLTLNVALDIINYCPKLKSAFFCLRTEKCHDRLKPSTINRHENLEDLVLVYYTNRQWRRPEYWNLLMAALTKFPNLKHLAIRFHCHIPEEIIIKILERFPNLREFDVRGAEIDSETLINEANSRRAVPVKISFCRYSLYRSPRPEMNPELDFMKHCFYTNVYELLPKLFAIGDDDF